MSTALRVSCLLLCVAPLVSCATQPAAAAYAAPGFIMGLVHGLIAPLALLGGLFTDARVYAFPNTGWWYDLGFMLGLTAWAGGGATAASK